MVFYGFLEQFEMQRFSDNITVHRINPNILSEVIDILNDDREKETDPRYKYYHCYQCYYHY